MNYVDQGTGGTRTIPVCSSHMRKSAFLHGIIPLGSYGNKPLLRSSWFKNLIRNSWAMFGSLLLKLHVPDRDPIPVFSDKSNSTNSKILFPIGDLGIKILHWQPSSLWILISAAWILRSFELPSPAFEWCVNWLLALLTPECLELNLRIHENRSFPRKKEPLW